MEENGDYYAFLVVLVDHVSLVLLSAPRACALGVALSEGSFCLSMCSIENTF